MVLLLVLLGVLSISSPLTFLIYTATVKSYDRHLKLSENQSQSYVLKRLNSQNFLSNKNI